MDSGRSTDSRPPRQPCRLPQRRTPTPSPITAPGGGGVPCRCWLSAPELRLPSSFSAEPTAAVTAWQVAGSCPASHRLSPARPHFTASGEVSDSHAHVLFYLCPRESRRAGQDVASGLFLGLPHHADNAVTRAWTGKTSHRGSG